MQNIWRAVVVAVAFSFGVSMARAEGDAWSFRLTPYAWAIGLEGDIGKGPVVAPVDVDFSDALSDLDLALMMAAEARKGAWGLLADISYLELSDDKGTALGELDAEVEQWILQAFALYRVSGGGATAIDVGPGLRSLDLDTDLSIGGREASATENWTDPVIMARLRQQFGPNCFGVLAGDIGGFGVSSDLTWQLTAAAGYAFTESVSLLLGYRYLDYDYDDHGLTYDASSSGFGLGLQFDL